MPANKAWTTEELTRLQEMIAGGATPVRLSAHFRRSTSSVRAMARQLGLTLTPLHVRNRLMRAKIAEAERAVGQR